MSAEERLHETHVCRDCGAEITLPYAGVSVPTEPGAHRSAPEATVLFFGTATQQPVPPPEMRDVRVPAPEPSARLREALNYALNQWAAYANEDPERTRGSLAPIAESTDGGDAEAAMFRDCRATLAATPQDPEA